MDTDVVLSWLPFKANESTDPHVHSQCELQYVVEIKAATGENLRWLTGPRTSGTDEGRLSYHVHMDLLPPECMLEVSALYRAPDGRKIPSVGRRECLRKPWAKVILLPSPKLLTMPSTLAEDIAGERAVLLDIGDAVDAVLEGSAELHVRGAEETVRWQRVYSLSRAKEGVIVRDLPEAVVQFKLERPESTVSDWVTTEVVGPAELNPELFADGHTVKVRFAAKVGMQIRYMVLDGVELSRAFVAPPGHTGLGSGWLLVPHRVGDLQTSVEVPLGFRYAFSARSISADGRYSSWTPPTSPVDVWIPAPEHGPAPPGMHVEVPGLPSEATPVRFVSATPTDATIAWRGFLSKSVRMPLSYEVRMQHASWDGAGWVVSSWRSGEPFDGALPTGDSVLRYALRDLEPARAYRAGVRARHFPSGPWSEWALSSWIPPRQEELSTLVSAAALVLSPVGVGVRVTAEVEFSKPEHATALECHRPPLELCQVRWKRMEDPDWHEGQPVGVTEQKPQLWIDGATLLASGVRPRDKLIFAARSRDGEGGAWSPWSPASAPVYFGLPRLTPPTRDEPGVNLQARAVGEKAYLSWPAFVVPSGGVEVDVPVQYKVEAQCGSDLQLADLVCKTGARLSLELSLKGPTQFRVSGRWKLEGLGADEWTEPIVSTIVAPKGFLPPSTPLVVVTASDAMGLYAVAEWRTESDSRAFQIRYMDEVWQTCPAVLSTENRARLPPEIPVGKRYSISVRVGDGLRWSEWSPASQPFLYSISPPVPVAGDVLQLIEDGGRLVLRWQPFRRASDELKDIEYKISYVEAGPETGHPQQDPLGQQLYWSARLAASTSRAAWHGKSLTTIGFKRHTTDDDVTFDVGRLAGRQVLRFFVCARYTFLRAGSSTVNALLPEGRTVGQSVSAAYPDEEIELSEHDDHLMVKVGLWSKTWQSPFE
jgi:hypothetical protein